MSRIQKRVLIVLVAVDLLVIAGLTVIVLKQTRASSAPSTSALDDTLAASIECTDPLLQALGRTGADVTVAWSPEAATSPAIIELHYGQDALPMDPSPQLLWSVMDRLPEALPSRCPVPSFLTISISAASAQETYHYIASLDGDTLSAWLRGDLDDDTLAARSRYRSW